MGSFWEKYILFQLKKNRGVIFHDTKEWCKIWRKTNLWFRKWQENFNKFSLEHLKVSKLGIWWDTFVESIKFMSWKLTEELCVRTMKYDAKREKKLTCCFNTDLKSLNKFWLEHSKVSKTCTLMWPFWPSYIIMFELKKYRGIIFDSIEYWCKIWRKTDLCFQKRHEEFSKISQAEK